MLLPTFLITRIHRTYHRADDLGEMDLKLLDELSIVKLSIANFSFIDNNRMGPHIKPPTVTRRDPDFDQFESTELTFLPDTFVLENHVWIPNLYHKGSYHSFLLRNQVGWVHHPHDRT